MITKKELEDLREKYPEGCRVRLTKMNDKYAPKIGEMGTCKGVDDIGSVMVSWDSGSSLSVVYGEDSCVRVRTCPKCKKEYTEYPAISRYDGKTEICPRCGNLEGLEVVGMPKDEIDKTMKAIDKAKKEIKANG